MSEKTAAEHRAAVLELLVRQTLCLEQDSLFPQYLFESEPGFAIMATFFLFDLFLLEGEKREGLEVFIARTLHRLLHQLSRSTERRQIEFRGQVRGRILWPATLKAWHTQDCDPTHYVCREVRHRYDTPENQLLKYLIERIYECIRAIPGVIRQGICYLPLTETSVSATSAIRLGRMEAAIRTLRRNACLSEVTVPNAIGEYHLLRAETAQLDEYAQVAHVYRRYHEVVLTPSWESLIRIGKRILPLPGQLGAEEDRWIRLGAAILRS